MLASPSLPSLVSERQRCECRKGGERQREVDGGGRLSRKETSLKKGQLKRNVDKQAVIGGDSLSTAKPANPSLARHSSTHQTPPRRPYSSTSPERLSQPAEGSLTLSTDTAG